MLKRFCDRCGKELEEGWSLSYRIQHNHGDKETHQSLIENKDLCEECHDYVIQEFNKLFIELNAERFIERA